MKKVDLKSMLLASITAVNIILCIQTEILNNKVEELEVAVESHKTALSIQADINDQVLWILEMENN